MLASVKDEIERLKTELLLGGKDGGCAKVSSQRSEYCCVDMWCVHVVVACCLQMNGREIRPFKVIGLVLHEVKSLFSAALWTLKQSIAMGTVASPTARQSICIYVLDCQLFICLSDVCRIVRF